MADQYNPYASESYGQPSRDEYIRDSAGNILGKRCPECGGSGGQPGYHTAWDKGWTCDRCRGDGRITDKTSYHGCAHCNNGCHRCNG